MAHIQIPPGHSTPSGSQPGECKALRELVEVLLPGPNALTPAEREMIATYVSRRMIAASANFPMVLRRQNILAATRIDRTSQA